MTAAAPWFVTAGDLAAHGWRAGWTTGAGPDFRSPTDGEEHGLAVERLAAAAGLDQAAWVRQVHGGTVLRAEAPGFAGEADGLWTDRPGLGVVGRSADCPLVLIGGADPGGRRVWGFAHASWRSTVAGITGHLVDALAAAGATAESMRATIGPSAGPCCYEVGPEVRDRARVAFGGEADWHFLERGGLIFFDLWTANRTQVERRGVPTGNISVAGVCTICGDLYPSFRREGEKAGRFAAIIGC